MEHWRSKFRFAFRGIRVGIVGQSSFTFHAVAGLAVIALAAWLEAAPWQWAVLLLCITLVLVAEMFNTALEYLARAITTETNEHIRDALDVASAAVLLAAIGAALVGLVVVW